MSAKKEIFKILACQSILALIILFPVISGNRTFITQGDSVDQSLCWISKVFMGVRDFQIPLWDFNTAAGTSFIGEMQTAPLYPITWIFGLFSTFDPVRRIDLFLVFHYLIAATGMHLCARRLGLLHVPSVLSALIFAYGSTFALRVSGQPNIFASLAWLPWIVTTSRLAI